jgi:hypothetical protein
LFDFYWGEIEWPGPAAFRECRDKKGTFRPLNSSICSGCVTKYNPLRCTEQFPEENTVYEGQELSGRERVEGRNGVRLRFEKVEKRLPDLRVIDPVN